MNVGLFLNVDDTLTVGKIQENYAKLLNIHEKHAKLEDEWTKHQNSNIFGRELIKLFNEASFNKCFAEKHFDNIDLQPWTQELLSLPATIYLVSSGPDYYINMLAAKYDINVGTNVFCSKYIFNSDNKLLSCSGVDGLQKRAFVTKKKINHDITIGIGERPEHDGPFVSTCEISLLRHNVDGYIYTPQLIGIKALVNRLVDLYLPSKKRIHNGKKPTLFLASSSENQQIAYALKTSLKGTFDILFWPENNGYTETIIGTLEGNLSKSNFAVFLITKDDLVISRGVECFKARDNVIFELGLFFGGLGRKNCVIVCQQDNEPDLPTDIRDIVRINYIKKECDNNLSQMMTPCATRIINTFMNSS